MWIVWVLVGMFVFECLCRLYSYFEDKKLRKKEDNGKETNEDIQA